MSLAALMVAMAFLGADPASSKDAPRLSQLAGAILTADYRGERPRLRELATALQGVKAPELAAYRDYWRGFALWRRAINGFNETPNPPDLRDDLREAVVSFRASLAHQPGWIEAQVGMVGCWFSLLYLSGEDETERRTILAEMVPMLREMTEKGNDNPRALWLVGGQQMWAPPPHGGDAVRASATYRRAVEAARREALKNGQAPAWIPKWGGPENLMSLAYLYAHSSARNRDLAEAYAEGALTAVPDWHYVADVLLPQIQALAPAAK
jgi:hypothetical protein